MSDMGDYGGGDYSGEQSFQTEGDFQRMLPGESEADWLKRLRAAGFNPQEFQGAGVPITGQAAPGFTNWENQIGKTSGTGPGSSNLGGTTPEAMKRGAGGGGGGLPQSAGSSSYANTLAQLMSANAGSGGGGGQGGGMDANGLHSNWIQGMGMGTMLSPQGNQGTTGAGPGAVYDTEGMRLARSSRGDPGSMANVLKMLMFQERPQWIHSKYINQENPYGNYNAGPMAQNYLNQLMQSRGGK